MSFKGSEIEHLNIYLPGSLEIKLDNQGQWLRVQHGIDNLTKGIRRAYEEATDQFAKRLIRIIKTAIKNGKSPGGGSWAPLAESTLRKYNKHFPGHGNGWKRTGKMEESIDLYGSEYGDRIYIGLSQYSPYTEEYERGEDIRKGMTVIQVAKMLEFGGYGGRIPARPLFNPALEKVGGKKEIKKLILEDLRKEARRLGFTHVRIR